MLTGVVQSRNLRLRTRPKASTMLKAMPENSTHSEQGWQNKGSQLPFKPSAKQETQANLPYTTSAKQESQAKPPAATEGRSVQRRQTGWQRWRVARILGRIQRQPQMAEHAVHCSELLHWHAAAADCHT